MPSVVRIHLRPLKTHNNNNIQGAGSKESAPRIWGGQGQPRLPKVG